MIRFRRSGHNVCVLVLLLLAGPIAHADGPRDAAALKQHLDRALAHYEAKQYAKAARSFRAAYEIDKSTAHLYAWAQSERLSGNCVGAIPLYAEFLSREPQAENAEVARRNLARCRELEPEAPLFATPPPPVVIVRQTPAPPPLPPPWYRDGLGWALGGAGLAAYVGSGAFALAANAAEDRRDKATTYDQFHQQTLAERRWNTLTTVGLVTGTTLVTAAAIRFFLRAR